MPTQSGPCSSIAAASRAPKGTTPVMRGPPLPLGGAARRAAVAAMCSCRLATSNGPASTASMPCTAAASWSTVVAIGLSAAVVAARIS